MQDSNPWTILKLLGWTASYFSERDIDSPRATAEILLAHSLGIRRIDLYVQYDRPMNTPELKGFKSLIRRRASREPVAYIVGEKEFWSMALAVTPAVLVPRPETECLVEAVLERMGAMAPSAPLRVLELGTGSGAVVLALAKERPGHWFGATDKQVEATVLARENAQRNGLDPAVRFVAGDWFAPFRTTGRRFDVIVSNPPYIPTADIAGLQPEVSRYEPARALDGGTKGLDCLTHLLRTAPGYLNPGGCLALEMGHDQKAAVARVASECDAYATMSFFKDYSGYDRGGLFIRR